MSETKPSPIVQSRELVEADLYDDLLNRYERALVYAGELREKLRTQAAAEEQFSKLQRDVHRLEKSVAVDEAYVRLLESALERLGILPSRTASSQGSSGGPSNPGALEK